MHERVESKRGFKDVFCTCMFAVVFILYIIVACFAFTYGEPQTLVSPPIGQLEDEIYAFDITEFEILRHDFSIVLASLMAAVLLSVVWFLAIKHLTAFMIYVTSAVSSIALSGFGFYLYSLSMRYHSFELTLVAILCWVISFIVVSLLLVFREKILFTAELVRESGRILQNNLATILLALVVSLLYLAFVALTIMVVLYLYSIPSESNTTILPLTISGDYIVTYNGDMRLLAWFIFFAALWISNVIFAVETFTVGYVTAHHINVNAKLAVARKNPITDGVATALSYSLGTLVFAGLVKAALTLLNTISKHVSKENRGASSCCTSYVFKVVKILVDSITEFAVVYAALSGVGFWSSAKRVSTLLKSELASVVVSKVIIHYIFITGQLLASVIITCTAVLIIVGSHDHLSAFVVIAVFLPAYFIFGTISTLYTTVVNTVLLILLIDHDKPTKRLPPSLTIFLDTEAAQV